MRFKEKIVPLYMKIANNIKKKLLPIILNLTFLGFPN